MNLKTTVLVAALVFVMLAPAVIAAEGIVGEWEFKSQTSERTMNATMTITKTEDGKYEGTWSARWGESKLSDIAFENGKVKFVQTSNFGGQEMKTTYEGTVENGKITGKGQGRFGEFNFEGTLQGEPKTGADAIVGDWQIDVTIPSREIVDKLIITKNEDGKLAGKWISQRGEGTVSNLKFEGGKLTFDLTTTFGDREFTRTFEGTVSTIKGAFTGGRGEREATATRVTAPKPDEGKKEDKTS